MAFPVNQHVLSFPAETLCRPPSRSDDPLPFDALLAISSLTDGKQRSLPSERILLLVPHSLPLAHCYVAAVPWGSSMAWRIPAGIPLCSRPRLFLARFSPYALFSLRSSLPGTFPVLESLRSIVAFILVRLPGSRPCGAFPARSSLIHFLVASFLAVASAFWSPSGAILCWIFLGESLVQISFSRSASSFLEEHRSCP